MCSSWTTLSIGWADPNIIWGVVILPDSYSFLFRAVDFWRGYGWILLHLSELLLFFWLIHHCSLCMYFSVRVWLGARSIVNWLKVSLSNDIPWFGFFFQIWRFRIKKTMLIPINQLIIQSISQSISQSINQCEMINMRRKHIPFEEVEKIWASSHKLNDLNINKFHLWWWNSM